MVLPEPELADDAEGLALVHLEADAVDGLHHAAAQVQMGLQVLDFQQRRCGQSCLRFGSSRSRSQSPVRLDDRQVSMMAMPGMVMPHQA